MRIVATIQPEFVTIDSTQNAFGGTINPQLPSGWGVLIIRNKSNYDLQLTFSNGSTTMCEARLGRKIVKELADWRITYRLLNGAALPGTPNTIIQSGYPVNQGNPFTFSDGFITIETYDLSETIPEVYPVVYPKVWPPSNLVEMLLNGSIFTASTGRAVAAVINNPLSLFNPIPAITPQNFANNKTHWALILEGSVSPEGGSTNAFLQRTAGAPSWVTIPQVNAHNNFAGSTSNMSVFWSAANQTGPSQSQQMKAYTIASNVTQDIVNGNYMLVGPGETVTLWSSGNTGEGHVSMNLVWFEF